MRNNFLGHYMKETIFSVILILQLINCILAKRHRCICKFFHRFPRDVSEGAFLFMQSLWYHIHKWSAVLICTNHDGRQVSRILTGSCPQASRAASWSCESSHTRTHSGSHVLRLGELFALQNCQHHILHLKAALSQRSACLWFNI